MGEATKGLEKIEHGWALLGNPGVASRSGIVRDESSNWVAGFTRKIGITSSFEAEL